MLPYQSIFQTFQTKVLGPVPVDHLSWQLWHGYNLILWVNSDFKSGTLKVLIFDTDRPSVWQHFRSSSYRTRPSVQM